MSNKEDKKVNANLTKEMIDNIKSYGNFIETIDDPIQAIRQTIGYHIGATGTMGHMTLIKEIVNNAFDEVLRTNSPCNYVKIIFDERDLSLVVQDNGRGIPFEKMYDVFCEHYTSSNYNKTSGDTKTAGVNGAGGKLVFALSNYFRAESYILGEAKYIEAHEGVIKSKKPESINNSNGYQGTIVKFTPSETLGQVSTTCDKVYILVYSLFPLLPIGTVVDFTGIDITGKVKYNESRTNIDGIMSALVDTVETPLIAPIHFTFNDGVCSTEVCFTYDAKNFDAELITSYANFCITLGGTHVDGFIDALCNYFRNYMNKIYLGNKSKVSVINNDIKTGLRAVVNASHINPIFNAQAKEILRNEDMYPFVRSSTTNYLNEWIKTNSSSLNKLCKYFKDVAELRMKSDDTKIKLSTKYQTSLLSGKPKKYLAPSGNKGLELLIVEGDSAGGGARVGRNSDNQGVFPIRGKLINAFSSVKSKFLSNQEVASIITLVGGGYGKNFDINKVPWEKIIIMADADPDGNHIRCLIMKLFLLYMPEIITSGRLYAAVPPLYGASVKGGTKYFTDKVDFVKYVQNIFAKNNTLSTLTNQKLTSNEIMNLFVTNADYVYELEIVSNTYAIEPKLLEDILIRYNVQNFDFKLFKKSLKALYRFIEIKIVNNVIMIEGLVNSKFHTIIINDKLLASCGKVLSIMRANKYLVYKVNGEILSLYELMKIYEKSKPSNITRYKGLGEMSPTQLSDSTLNANNRTLIQYTIDDIKKDINSIRYIESNKASIFTNLVVTRQDIE